MSLFDKDHRYSFTQLSAFAECPYQFHKLYVDRVERLENAYSQAGTLVHDLIDKWAKGTIPADNLVEIFDKRWANEVTESFPPILKDARSKTYESFRAYFETFDMFSEFGIVDSEWFFETEIGGRPFVGIIDMILRDPETDELIILDHKSKSLSSFKKEQNNMYAQQLLYSKPVFERFGKYPDRLMFNLFKENGLRPEKPFKMNEFCDTVQWAENIIDRIERSDIFDFMEIKQRKDFFCSYICSARKACEEDD